MKKPKLLPIVRKKTIKLFDFSKYRMQTNSLSQIISEKNFKTKQINRNFHCNIEI